MHFQNSKAGFPNAKVAEVALASLGIALLVCGAATNQRWLDQHFLPTFNIGRALYVRIETAIRVVMATIGVTLATVARRRIAAVIGQDPLVVFSSVAAAILALAASELVLSHLRVPAPEWLVHGEEPRRQADRRLGWTLVPFRVGHLAAGGRTVEYAIDRSGYRARTPDDSVDPARPTIVFVGESIIFGEGLTFDESIPAQVTGLTGLQSANLGVGGYSNDQAFLRLQQELPRFSRPVAVVSLFMPVLFGRNLDDGRPHLGPGLTWQPPVHHARLVLLGRVLVPYRRELTIVNGIAHTRDVLRATEDLARARGAAPLLIVPQIGAEDPREAALRRRVLDDGGIPYIPVPIDCSWTISPEDRHPDATGAHAIALAVARAYDGTLPSAPLRRSGRSAIGRTRPSG